jgi:hypothetical protein
MGENHINSSIVDDLLRDALLVVFVKLINDPLD